jgi:hypothetical protein
LPESILPENVNAYSAAEALNERGKERLQAKAIAAVI